MLLNEFLKQHRQVEEQTSDMQEQKNTISGLTARVARQEATIAQQQLGMDVLP